MKTSYQVVTLSGGFEEVILVTDSLKAAHKAAVRASKTFAEAWVEEARIWPA